MASNKTLVPQAKQALEQFKMEAANEVGVTLKQGYNGDLTSRQAGSVGGQMVKKMVESYENWVQKERLSQMIQQEPTHSCATPSISIDTEACASKESTSTTAIIIILFFFRITLTSLRNCE